MKKTLIGLLTLASISSFAATQTINCNGGNIKVLDNFSYTVEDITFNQEVTLEDSESVMILVEQNEIKVLTTDDLYNTELKGKSVLLLSNTLNQDDSIGEGISLFNSTVKEDLISDSNLEFTMRTANIYPQVNFSLMDIEKGFYFGCSKVK